MLHAVWLCVLHAVWLRVLHAVWLRVTVCWVFQVSDLNKQLQRQLKETNASLRSAEAAAKESAEHLANLDHGKSSYRPPADCLLTAY